MPSAEFFLSANGRINRQAYWLQWMVPYMVIYIILIVIEQVVGITATDAYGNPGIGYLSMIFALVALYPGIVIGIKRLHDVNKSGWFFLLFFVPILNLWPIILTWFLKGTDGPNRFGDDPLGG